MKCCRGITPTSMYMYEDLQCGVTAFIIRVHYHIIALTINAPCHVCNYVYIIDMQYYCTKSILCRHWLYGQYLTGISSFVLCSSFVLWSSFGHYFLCFETWSSSGHDLALCIATWSSSGHDLSLCFATWSSSGHDLSLSLYCNMVIVWP